MHATLEMDQQFKKKGTPAEDVKRKPGRDDSDNFKQNRKVSKQQFTSELNQKVQENKLKQKMWLICT